MTVETREQLEQRFQRLLVDARAAAALNALAPGWIDALRAFESRGAVPGAISGAVSGAPSGVATGAASGAAPRKSARSTVATQAEARAESAGASASDAPGRFGMLGASARMRVVFELLERICKSDVPVLVQGETGTGKELVARALHQYGPRARKPFLAENCAAVPAQLLESELFGHKRGSFTGAIADRAGHFVAADGGTVFLDEIGDMPLSMQAKLLRVLQEGEVRAVGSNQTVHVDVRVVGATNKDLRAMCAAKTFREDLYYRLSVVTVQLPPLRERDGDIRILAGAFVRRIGAEMGRANLELSEAALVALERWRWPGNVRELDNEMRRAIALLPSGRGAIEPADLSPQLGG
jgi:transcriptional regulator with GAF, ATPase, and Fis domain